ncbi:hypothetical protein AB1K70_16855 [Bremerella sp. JC770]|uniref:hypothetical protein n=1 Tax=Bremerella sp. JC770 TaxID=3232137 RepID=UPI003457DCE1
MKRKRVYSVIPKPSPPAVASDYLGYFPDIVTQLLKNKPTAQVVLYIRVSARSQFDRGTNKGQETECVTILEQLGVSNIKIFREVVAGWELLEPCRSRLIAAAELAEKSDGVVVASNTQRFLRNEYYSRDDFKRVPTVAEFDSLLARLNKFAPTTRLMTLLDPDLTPGEIRGVESRWGQKRTGKKGGRPKKKSPGHRNLRRRVLLPLVKELHQQGKSARQIVHSIKEFCIENSFDLPNQSTINSWIRKYLS